MRAALILIAAVASLVTAGVICVLVLNGAIVLMERIDEWLEKRSAR